VVGVDLARHWVRALVSDLAGRAIGRADYPVSDGASAAERSAAARTAITEALRLADRDAAQILAAAAATVGIARADGQVVRSTIPQMEGHSIAEMLGAFLPVPVPVRVANDMRAAVLAEYWVGAAVGCSSAVYLHVGRRIGSSYLIDGVSPLGHHGAAGEIPPESGRRLVDAYRKLVSFTGVGVDTLSRDEMLGIDPLTVFEAAQRGEADARHAVADFADEFAAAIEGLVITVDPEVVVVGGGVVVAGDIAAEAIRSRLARVCVFEPRVVVSPLGESAAAMGAVRLALSEVEEMLFSNPFARGQTAEEAG
jgi:predicted NBD/HSP70 family sugar kinase